MTFSSFPVGKIRPKSLNCNYSFHLLSFFVFLIKSINFGDVSKKTLLEGFVP